MNETTPAQTAVADAAAEPAMTQDRPGPESAGGTVVGAADAGRRSSSHRLRVTAADLEVYAAIVGRRLTESERLAALAIPAGPESRPADGAEAPPSAGATDPAAETDGAAGELSRAWSPVLFCSHLRDFCSDGLTMRARRPHIGDWVRRLGGEARRCLHETQARLGR